MKKKQTQNRNKIGKTSKKTQKITRKNEKKQEINHQNLGNKI